MKGRYIDDIDNERSVEYYDGVILRSISSIDLCHDRKYRAIPRQYRTFRQIGLHYRVRMANREKFIYGNRPVYNNAMRI